MASNSETSSSSRYIAQITWRLHMQLVLTYVKCCQVTTATAPFTVSQTWIYEATKHWVNSRLSGSSVLQLCSTMCGRLHTILSQVWWLRYVTQVHVRHCNGSEWCHHQPLINQLGTRYVQQEHGIVYSHCFAEHLEYIVTRLRWISSFWDSTLQKKTC